MILPLLTTRKLKIFNREKTNQILEHANSIKVIESYGETITDHCPCEESRVEVFLR